MSDVQLTAKCFIFFFLSFLNSLNISIFLKIVWKWYIEIFMRLENVCDLDLSQHVWRRAEICEPSILQRSIFIKILEE